MNISLDTVRRNDDLPHPAWRIEPECEHQCFNRPYLNELLDLYQFRNLAEVRKSTYWWMLVYNYQIPPDYLWDLVPVEYMSKNTENTIFQLST